MKRSFLALVCSAALLLSACPKSDTPGGGTFSEMIDEAIAIQCDLIFSCDVQGESGMMRALLGSRENCVPILEDMVSKNGETDAIEALIADGTLAFDATAAQRCLNATRGECRIMEHWNPVECADVLEGNVAVGDDCNRTEECVGDAYCDFGADECPGTCVARKALGVSCAAAVECSHTGLGGTPNCHTRQDATSICVDLRVSDAPAAEGDACGESEPVSNVVTWTDCESGAYCDDEQDGTCVALAAGGAACGRDGVCDGGQTCLNGFCREIAVVSTEGGSCTASVRELGAEGAFRFCSTFDRLECVEGACDLVGNGTAGARCRAKGDWVLDCNNGLVCLLGGDTAADYGTCGAPLAIGEDCVLDDECESSSCGTDDTCDAASACD